MDFTGVLEGSARTNVGDVGRRQSFAFSQCAFLGSLYYMRCHIIVLSKSRSYTGIVVRAGTVRYLAVIALLWVSWLLRVHKS